MTSVTQQTASVIFLLSSLGNILLSQATVSASNLTLEKEMIAPEILSVNLPIIASSVLSSPELSPSPLALANTIDLTHQPLLETLSLLKNEDLTQALQSQFLSSSPIDQPERLRHFAEVSETMSSQNHILEVPESDTLFGVKLLGLTLLFSYLMKR